MWLKVFLNVVPVAALLAAAVAYAAFRWDVATRKLRVRLEGGRVPIRPPVIDFAEFADLPAPVQRYFRTALRDGQPMVAGAHVRHRGTLNVGETADRWKPFTSRQLVVTRRPGFLWDGRVNMLPGLPVRVHDAYVAGEGILHASLLGLFSLIDRRDRGDLAEGELMRFFAEAAWFPTSLLPSQGVHWKAVNDRSAYATLTEASTSLTMLFIFNEEGLIDSVHAGARGRMVGDKIVPTPWHGRFWSYGERGGMQVPLEGEVAWLLPQGEKPYWRGRITEIAYEFVR
jgi:hypothetical protein